MDCSLQWTLAEDCTGEQAVCSLHWELQRTMPEPRRLLHPRIPRTEQDRVQKQDGEKPFLLCAWSGRIPGWTRTTWSGLEEKPQPGAEEDRVAPSLGDFLPHFPLQRERKM